MLAAVLLPYGLNYLVFLCFVHQVSWGMLAIAVAVRIDVYGVFYALALGLLLFTPRKILAPVWLCYLILHGILLLLQYSFLLGLPPGVCLGTEGNAGRMIHFVQ